MGVDPLPVLSRKCLVLWTCIQNFTVVVLTFLSPASPPLQYMYKSLFEWCSHNNRENKLTASLALEAFFQQVTSLLLLLLCCDRLCGASVLGSCASPGIRAESQWVVAA